MFLLFLSNHICNFWFVDIDMDSLPFANSFKRERVIYFEGLDVKLLFESDSNWHIKCVPSFVAQTYFIRPRCWYFVSVNIIIIYFFIMILNIEIFIKFKLTIFDDLIHFVFVIFIFKSNKCCPMIIIFVTTP